MPGYAAGMMVRLARYRSDESMRVSIEVISGPTSGKRHQILSRQVNTFGRTRWADVAFPSDDQMSSSHFAVERDDEWCWLKDLGSTNGTRLNGEFVKEAVVKNGDRIVAGATEFLVHISPHAQEEDSRGSTVASAAPPIVVDSSRHSPSPGGPSSFAFSVESCDSGLTLFRGIPDETAFRASAIAEKLAASLTLVLVMHFEKFGGEPPEDLPADAILFDWLPQEIAKRHSPVVLAANDLADWRGHLDAGWDHDAVLCFFNRGKPDGEAKSRAETIRSCLRQSDDDGGSGLLGTCWPSVLSQLLTFRDPAYVEPLLGDVEGVLMEVSDLAATWQIFGRPSLENTLSAIGFARIEDEVSTT